MTIEITLHEPWVSRVLPEGGSDEQPLSALRNDGSHLHGELRIVVNGQLVPRMGFFGPRDVCLADWLRELIVAAKALRSSDPARYVFDECEQGQPAFLFERSGNLVSVSVVDSEVGDGTGSPEWGRQTCGLDEFEAEVSRFESELEETLEQGAPGHGRAWVRTVTEAAVEQAVAAVNPAAWTSV